MRECNNTMLGQFFCSLHFFLLSCSHIFNHLDILYNKRLEIGHDQNEDIFHLHIYETAKWYIFVINVDVCD